MSLSITDAIILGLIPLGQLYARVVNLNGSLDQKWALLPFFMIPPLQLIPTFMMKFGMFKKGKGGKPYDWFMLIPIIIKLILVFALENFKIEFPYYLIINLVISLVIVCIPYLIRINKLCMKYNFKNIVNAFTEAAVVEAIATAFSLIIGLIPFVGTLFKILKVIPIIGVSLPWIIAYVAGYVVTNMINSDAPFKYCFESKYNILVLVIALGVSGGLKFFK